jgi:hypothetical protein
MSETKFHTHTEPQANDSVVKPSTNEKRYRSVNSRSRGQDPKQSHPEHSNIGHDKKAKNVNSVALATNELYRPSDR